jgi:hypothetical protein
MTNQKGAQNVFRDDFHRSKVHKVLTISGIIKSSICAPFQLLEII